MSKSTPRLVRSDKAKEKYGRKSYRQAMPYLLNETGNRCTYSCQHLQRANGKLEVDHFNSTLKHPERNFHDNLVAASRHCNGAKWNWWPTKSEQKLGGRFLNPYEELDYGLHLFENPVSCEIESATVEGCYHIAKLDLNAPHLVRERRQRAEIRAQLTIGPVTIVGPISSVQECARLLSEQAEEMIPTLPLLGQLAD